MAASVTVQGEVTQDGQIIVYDLPPDTPRGAVTITIEPMPEDEDPEDIEIRELMRKYPNGMGLSAGEIAKSPEFGAWAHRTDITSGEAYVEKIRRKRYTW